MGTHEARNKQVVERYWDAHFAATGRRWQPSSPKIPTTPMWG